MSFREYILRMEAYSLRMVDKRHEMHLQALINRQANATKVVGKREEYVYKSMKEFFDYDKEIAKVKGSKKGSLSERHRRMARIAKELNERR